MQATQPIPFWKNLFYLCNDPIVWMLYTFMTFIVIFTAYFLQRFENPKMDWFLLTIHGICCCCGFTCTYKPENISNRIFYTFCNLGAMLFCNICFAFTMNFLTTSIYENQIEWQNIMDGSFDLAGDGFALQHLMKQNQVNVVSELIN